MAAVAVDVVGLSANQLLGGTTTISIRFAAAALRRAWQVDDVYVDPFKDWYAPTSGGSRRSSVAVFSL